jgi:dimethylglycine oxidase
VGLESWLLDPDQGHALVPVVDPGAIRAGLHVTSDCIAKPVWAAAAMADRAPAKGARFERRVQVTGFDVNGGRIRAGETSRDRIRTGLVVYTWLSTELGSLGTQVDVQYLRERHPATVAAASLLDPEMRRMGS